FHATTTPALSTLSLHGALPIFCPSGAVVLLTDYVSTQVALSDLSGRTQSASFLSTGSTRTDGLAFALSGDVALPSARPVSNQIRSEEHTSELQSRENLVCRHLL